MRAIFESDSLLTRIDSQIRTVKGLPAKKRVKRNYESPLEEQLVRRKELSDRVEALYRGCWVQARAPDCERRLAELERSEGRTSEAGRAMAEYVGAVPDDGSAWSFLAEIERDRGRCREAVRLLEKAEIQARDPVWLFLAPAQSARILAAGGSWALAEQAMTRAVRNARRQGVVPQLAAALEGELELIRRHDPRVAGDVVCAE